MNETTGIVTKLAPHALLGTAIASGIVLFVPIEIAKVLGVYSLRTDFRPYIGWLFILSVSIFVCWIVETLILSKKRRGEEMRLKEEVAEKKKRLKEEHKRSVEENLKTSEQLLHGLTDEEKTFIAPFIFKNITAQYASLQNGVVQSLIRKNILVPPTIGNLLEFPLQIRQWALKYLKEHPEVLEEYENAPSLKKRTMY